MIEVIEAPNKHESDRSRKTLFLAGGITGCWDWQRDLITQIQSTNIVIYNPRRAQFPMDNPNAAREQTQWEYEYIRKADATVFWFPSETDCPITLFELGSALERNPKNLFIGTELYYARRQDVVIQSELARYPYVVSKWLDVVAEDISLWANT